MSLLKTWNGLNLQKRIIAIVAVTLSVAFILLLGRGLSRPDYQVLYTGLESATAGEVVAELDKMGVPFEVKGDTIYAPRGQKDTLRLELARLGLPRQNVVGYEVFDDMNSFTVSSEMFDTAYWRAKEGEVTRTILAFPNVTAARVHFGAKRSGSFRSEIGASNASVTVTTSQRLTKDQARAIQYVTALAVDGMTPEDIAVIDTRAGLVAGPGLDDEGRGDFSADIDRAASLKANLISILEARYGAGNVRVSVSMQIGRTKEQMTERIFDPDKRVLRSQTTSETTTNSEGTNNAVTVASNLPEGAGGASRSNSERSETSETVSYEVSEIVRNTETLPGEIKRMTVAILINDAREVDEDGQISFVPRPQEELAAIEDLARDASGLDTSRGDSLTVRSMPFDELDVPEMIAQPTTFERFVDRYLWALIQTVILAIVTLGLGLFVIRPILSSKSRSAEIDEDGLGVLSIKQNVGPSLIEEPSNVAALPAPGSSVAADFESQPDDPSRAVFGKLQTMTESNQDDAIDVISGWLSDDKPAISGAG